jgi:hypothetical protein
MGKFTVEAVFPSLPKTPAPVLSLVAPEVSESSLRAFAREFGLRGQEAEGAVRSHSTAILYTEGSVQVQLFHGSGGVRRRDFGSWMRSEQDSSFEITDEAAVEAARDAVRGFLFLNEAAAGGAVVKRLNVASSQPGGQSFSQRVTHAAVCFHRSVSGIPVDGPGGKMTVFLSPERKLTGVDFLWRRISGVYRETERLRTAEEAVRQVTDSWEERGVASGVVDQVRFGYLELGWSDEQALMQPAYIVFGVLGGPDGQARSGVVEVVHASADPVGDLVPPPPRTPKQTARSA